MNSTEIIKQAEKAIRNEFERIEDIRDFNQEKVLNAFIENKVNNQQRQKRHTDCGKSGAPINFSVEPDKIFQSDRNGLF